MAKLFLDHHHFMSPSIMMLPIMFPSVFPIAPHKSPLQSCILQPFVDTSGLYKQVAAKSMLIVAFVEIFKTYGLSIH